jgi:hypothetical protein
MLNNASRQPAIHPAMAERPERVERLTRVCVDDLLFAFGLGKLRHARRPLELLFQIPARRLASQVAIYDGIVGDLGLRAGGAWALERMFHQKVHCCSSQTTPDCQIPSPCSPLSREPTCAWWRRSGRS